jgi:putative FmdB family regulatory protein
MPIYEYRCQNCGFQKEHLQKMNDPAFSTCPECGAHQYTKLISAVGFQLKGNGWYATDFKSSNAKSAEPAPPAPPCGAKCACHPS